MATILLVLVVVLVVAGLVYGVVALLSGDDPGMWPVDPDGVARPLPHDRSLREQDLSNLRFDVAFRGYRMAQVDRALRRTAYDLGYKDEMIAVLEAEVAALREGRMEDAELLRKAREGSTPPPERDANIDLDEESSARTGEVSEPEVEEGTPVEGDVIDSDDADEKPEPPAGPVSRTKARRVGRPSQVSPHA